jgi:hypothetical protein
VGGDEGREAGRFDERREGSEDMVGGLGIEIAGRLISEQDARAAGDSPVLHPLLLRKHSRGQSRHAAWVVR